MTYNWIASLTLLAIVVSLSLLGYFLAFRVPALQKMRDINREQDRIKKAMEKYPPIIKANNGIGMAAYLVFFVGIAPWITTLDTQPVWKGIVDILVILMVYDFFYYLMHRFLFHGKSFFRQVHALHHQARNPTHIDAYYVHPLETFMGIALYIGTVAALGFMMGPFHAVSIAMTFFIFIQINIINHTFVDLPYFPFKTLSWITAKHHVHHENMQKGNYATITLLFDKMFGTLD